MQFIDPPGKPAYMENVIIIQNEPGIQEVSEMLNVRLVSVELVMTKRRKWYDLVDVVVVS